MFIVLCNTRDITINIDTKEYYAVNVIEDNDLVGNQTELFYLTTSSLNTAIEKEIKLRFAGLVNTDNYIRIFVIGNKGDESYCFPYIDKQGVSTLIYATISSDGRITVTNTTYDCKAFAFASEHSSKETPLTIVVWDNNRYFVVDHEAYINKGYFIRQTSFPALKLPDDIVIKTIN